MITLTVATGDECLVITFQLASPGRGILAAIGIGRIILERSDRAPACPRDPLIFFHSPM